MASSTLKPFAFGEGKRASTDAGDRDHHESSGSARGHREVIDRDIGDVEVLANSLLQCCTKLLFSILSDPRCKQRLDVRNIDELAQDGRLHNVLSTLWDERLFLL